MAEEEVNLVQNAVPESTHYKNKWAYGIFEEWQRQRLVNAAIQAMFLPVKKCPVRNVKVGSSANTCKFMSSAYFKNCSIKIRASKQIIQM